MHVKKKSAVVDTECYWAPEVNKQSELVLTNPSWTERSVYQFPSIPSCKVPLALKRSVATHRFLNKICFNEGYLSSPKICRSNLETSCISTSESVWRIFSFPNHKRFLSFFHVDVHLESVQRVYFDHNNVRERVENPRKTTLMAFFKHCQEGNFAKSLLYEDVSSYYRFDKLFKMFILN